MVAPVCHDSRDQVIIQPAPKAQPAIPLATDLASALAAIAAMRIIIYNLTQFPNSNNMGSKLPPPPKVGKYVEHIPQRIMKTVKIYSKQDPSVFVEFQQINGMTFQDTQNGEKWTWARGNDT